MVNHTFPAFKSMAVQPYLFVAAICRTCRIPGVVVVLDVGHGTFVGIVVCLFAHTKALLQSMDIYA
jgi:hypothetical protein